MPPAASGAVCSSAFVADWTSLLIGLRPTIGMRVKVLEERYLADEGAYGLVAWIRGDVGLEHPELFSVITGIKVS